MGKISSILKGAKGIGSDLKWAGKKIFEEVPEAERAKDGMGLYQKVLPYKVKGKVAAAGLGAYGLYEVGTSGVASRNSAMLGAVDAGEGLSGMTSTVEKSPLLKKLQKGEYADDRVMGSIDNAGADGDIVFALHNMR